MLFWFGFVVEERNGGGGGGAGRKKEEEERREESGDRKQDKELLFSYLSLGSYFLQLGSTS